MEAPRNHNIVIHCNWNGSRQLFQGNVEIGTIDLKIKNLAKRIRVFFPEKFVSGNTHPLKFSVSVEDKKGFRFRSEELDMLELSIDQINQLEIVACLLEKGQPRTLYMDKLGVIHKQDTYIRTEKEVHLEKPSLLEGGQSYTLALRVSEDHLNAKLVKDALVEKDSTTHPNFNDIHEKCKALLTSSINPAIVGLHLSQYLLETYTLEELVSLEKDSRDNSNFILTNFKEIISHSITQSTIDIVVATKKHIIELETMLQNPTDIRFIDFMAVLKKETERTKSLRMGISVLKAFADDLDLSDLERLKTLYQENIQQTVIPLGIDYSVALNFPRNADGKWSYENIAYNILMKNIDEKRSKLVPTP